MSKSKNHDAIPIPPVEVYARAVGKFQYTCPNCHQQHPLQVAPWRRNFIQCRHCRVKFQTGLGFSADWLPSAFIMGKWVSFVANRINPSGTPFDGGAKLYGSLEWECPVCKHPQVSFLKHTQEAECEQCHHGFFISVLFYRLPKSANLRLPAPVDSLVKGLHHAEKTLQPLPAAPPDQSAGTPSSRFGGDS